MKYLGVEKNKPGPGIQERLMRRNPFISGSEEMNGRAEKAALAMWVKEQSRAKRNRVEKNDLGVHRAEIGAPKKDVGRLCS